MHISIFAVGLTVFSLLAIAVHAETQISLFDMVPGISQIKTAVQLIMGDSKGASETFVNYLNDGLGPAQLRSGYFLLSGDHKKAGDIQLKFLNNLEPLVDGLPIVGHAKGIYHLIRNETDRGWQAIKASTSSVGTVIGAVAGGPAGAVGGHLLSDLLISGVGTAITNNESDMHGFVKYLNNLDKMTVGNHFDAMAGLALDAAGAKAATTKLNAQRGNRINTRGRYQNLQEETGNRAAEKVVLDVAPVAVRPSEDVPIEPVPIDAYKYVSNDLTNRMRMHRFYRFVKKDKEYSSLTPSDMFSKFSVDGMRLYKEDDIINNLPISTLTNKLKYLNEEELSLILNSDFRLVNTAPNMHYSFLCSVSGILGIDTLTLMEKLDIQGPFEYNEQSSLSVVQFLDTCKSKNLLHYEESGRLVLGELDPFLREHYLRLRNKHLILRKISPNGNGYAVVLKYKLTPSMLNSIKLFIDFQVEPMMTPILPNPYRFENFLEDKVYSYYDLYMIDKLDVTTK